MSTKQRFSRGDLVQSFSYYPVHLRTINAKVRRATRLDLLPTEFHCGMVLDVIWLDSKALPCASGDVFVLSVDGTQGWVFDYLLVRPPWEAEEKS